MEARRGSRAHHQTFHYVRSYGRTLRFSSSRETVSFISVDAAVACRFLLFVTDLVMWLLHRRRVGP